MKYDHLMLSILLVLTSVLSAQFRVMNNSSVLMEVKQSGQVGINVSPDRALDVSGTVRFRNLVRGTHQNPVLTVDEDGDLSVVNDGDRSSTNEIQDWNSVIDEGNILSGLRNPILNNYHTAGATHVNGILHFGANDGNYNINRQTWGTIEKLVIGAKGGVLELVTTQTGQAETHARICIRSDGLLRIRGIGDPCAAGEIDPQIHLRFETP